MSDDVKKLAIWKESLFRLPENKFLNTIRMYVGTIKTPYNKERLINDLVSFLYKEEHKKSIMDLLSARDLLFINAINFLESPTSETLLSFFEGEFSTFYLYDYIANLEERLLIFRCYDETTKKEYLDINPLLYKNIEPYLNLFVLLPLEKKESSAEKKDTVPALSASLFASWYSFIAQYPDACRADGTFKKKIYAFLESIFYGVSAEFLAYLNTAFVNLGLFFHDGANLCINEKKWAAFCNLPQETQNIHVCIASFRRFPRDTLVKQVLFAKNLIESIPNEGFTKTVILRLGFILRNSQNGTQREKKIGFFANVLQKAQSSSSLDDEVFTDSALIERLEYFGLLKCFGQTSEGTELIISGLRKQEESGWLTPFISINAGFSVTFLANAELSVLLPLVSCMNISSFDTVCRYEITRASCMRSFDKGNSSETLLKILSEAAGSALSQNLTFSINEWYETYTSASLYHGYVLQVSQEKIVQIENNAVLKQRIKKILAPGIYVFDFETKEEIIAAIEKSTLDFIGLPKNAIKEPDVLPYTDVNSNKRLILDYAVKTKDNEKEVIEHLKIMKKELDELHLPIEQKEGLLERINRKLIVTKTQLVGETVRLEKTEASGMDFMGKIQVIEQAILASNMIEITSATGIYTGRPVKIEKRDGDAGVTLTQEDSKTITLLIAQARNVKRFRQSLF